MLLLADAGPTGILLLRHRHLLCPAALPAPRIPSQEVRFVLVGAARPVQDGQEELQVEANLVVSARPLPAADPALPAGGDEAGPVLPVQGARVALRAAVR